MTDLSGIEFNKVFKTGTSPGAPYYYIHAHLDLAGIEVDPQAQNGLTLYFNKDNNYDYLDPLKAPTYSNFYIIDENAVVGEVVAYSNPDLVSENFEDVEFDIGGAEDTSTAVVNTWGGQTGYTAGLVNIADVNTGSICYYGHEGGNPFDPNASYSGKYLAVTILPGTPLAALARKLKAAEEAKAKQESSRSHRRNAAKNVRQLAPAALSSGILYVVVKVYPKFQ